MMTRKHRWMILAVVIAVVIVSSMVFTVLYGNKSWNLRDHIKKLRELTKPDYEKSILLDRFHSVFNEFERDLISAIIVNESQKLIFVWVVDVEKVDKIVSKLEKGGFKVLSLERIPPTTYRLLGEIVRPTSNGVKIVVEVGNEIYTVVFYKSPSGLSYAELQRLKDRISEELSRHNLRGKVTLVGVDPITTKILIGIDPKHYNNKTIKEVLRVLDKLQIPRELVKVEEFPSFQPLNSGRDQKFNPVPGGVKIEIKE